MSAELIYSRFLDVIEPGASAAVAARRMEQHGVRHLVVIDHDRRAVGMLTDRDLVFRVMAKGLDADLTEVEEIMSAPPITSLEDVSLSDALRVMQKAGIRHLPVLSKSGQLVGLVSLDNILLSVADEMKRVGDLLAVEPIAEAALVGQNFPSASLGRGARRAAK